MDLFWLMIAGVVGLLIFVNVKYLFERARMTPDERQRFDKEVDEELQIW